MKLRQAANQVKLSLTARYGYFSEDKPIVTIRDGESPGGPHAVVSWECGPPQWATNDTYWLHEEIAPVIAEFSVNTQYKASYYKPYFDEIEGFIMEAINSYELGIYPD